MRINTKVTLAPGTPINVAAALELTDNHMANRVSIQMATGGSGLGYVMDGIAVGRTPATTNASDVTVELYPATSTAPGGQYSDPEAAIDFSMSPAIDLSMLWIDGAEADPVRISAVLNI
jgi:hypothetical protein